MSYCKFSEDFINRTKQIIFDYRELFEKEIKENQGYEITLLLNCMLGLAVFTKDKFFDHLTNEKTFKNRIGKLEGVTISGKIPKFKNGVCALRNTIAHFADSSNRYKNEFKINDMDISLNEKLGEVETIEFNCKQDRIDYKILIDLKKNKLALEKFLIKLCNEIMN